MPVSKSNVYSINTGLVISSTNPPAGKLVVAIILLSNMSSVNWLGNDTYVFPIMLAKLGSALMLFKSSSSKYIVFTEGGPEMYLPPLKR